MFCKCKGKIAVLEQKIVSLEYTTKYQAKWIERIGENLYALSNHLDLEIIHVPVDKKTIKVVKKQKGGSNKGGSNYVAIS